MLTTPLLKFAYMSTSKTATHGGPRPGAGRPRKGEQPRVTISFSVDRRTAQKVQELRNDRVAVNEILDDYICSIHHAHFDLSE